MLDGVEGTLSRGRTVLVGWILPFGLVTVPTLLLLTSSSSTTHVVVGWAPDATDRTAAMPVLWPGHLLAAVLLLALVAAGGLVLNLFRRALYRVLTGRLFWPRPLAEHRTMSHFVRRNRLRDRAVVQRGSAKAMLLERARRYPGSSDQIAPTLFGNAVRRVELYGFDRYRLDAGLLWQELRSVAPGTALSEEVRARGAVDFFVCLLWSLVLAGSATLIGFTVLDPALYPALGVAVSVAIVGAVGAYHGAVSATDRWDSTVRGLVNLGRAPLADSLGLRIPDSLEQEREMWRRVNWLVRLDFDDRLQPELDPYRAPARVGKG